MPESRWLHDRLTLTGLMIVSSFLVLAIAAPVIAPYNPAGIDPAHRLEGISSAHIFGTDNLGRDLFSRMAYGARWSLGAAALATAAIVCIGVVVGTAAGYKGGRTGDVLMRTVDVVLAFPSLLLALAIAGTLGPGIGSVMVGLVSVGWAAYARVVRGMVLELRERDFVAAARALGASDRYIVTRHIIPNVLPAITVLATVEMGELILALAGFGFLGVGIQPPTPEWGAMINDARPFVLDAPALVVVPGIAIGLLVGGFNLLGDGLRDALDPRSAPVRETPPG
ncbi:MAG TPA: ABC transporter permease subunit [Gemmatimonadaceae bacterium]|nr:ABC transporter permease subunit [Gemmatimonadaceae bacterium]